MPDHVPSVLMIAAISASFPPQSAQEKKNGVRAAPTNPACHFAGGSTVQ